MADVPLRALLPFFTGTFALSWGLIGVLLVFAAQLEPWLGEPGAGHPLFVLAVYAPAISAWILVVRYTGRSGLALPLLQRRLAPLWAGLVLGAAWGLWHLPAFYLAGSLQSGWGFAPFFLGTVAASVILTGLFNASGGSILLAALFHFQLINPLWPDAQPYDTPLFVAVAAIVAWLQRRTMLARPGPVTAVVP